MFGGTLNLTQSSPYFFPQISFPCILWCSSFSVVLWSPPYCLAVPLSVLSCQFCFLRSCALLKGWTGGDGKKIPRTSHILMPPLLSPSLSVCKFSEHVTLCVCIVCGSCSCYSQSCLLAVCSQCAVLFLSIVCITRIPRRFDFGQNTGDHFACAHYAFYSVYSIFHGVRPLQSSETVISGIFTEDYGTVLVKLLFSRSMHTPA